MSPNITTKTSGDQPKPFGSILSTPLSDLPHSCPESFSLLAEMTASVKWGSLSHNKSLLFASLHFLLSKSLIWNSELLEGNMLISVIF